MLHKADTRLLSNKNNPTNKKGGGRSHRYQWLITSDVTDTLNYCFSLFLFCFCVVYDLNYHIPEIYITKYDTSYHRLQNIVPSNKVLIDNSQQYEWIIIMFVFQINTIIEYIYFSWVWQTYTFIQSSEFYCRTCRTFWSHTRPWRHSTTVSVLSRGSQNTSSTDPLRSPTK